MARSIHVVGLGVEAGGQLTDGALAALDSAGVIVGAERQLDWLLALEGVDRFRPKFKNLPKLSELNALIDRHDDEVAILASGDPLHFGIGRMIGAHCDQYGIAFQVFRDLESARVWLRTSPGDTS